MPQPVDIFVTAFVTLFVVIDPPGIAPIFAGLTKDHDASYQRGMALKGTLVSAIVLVFFAFVGDPFLAALGITLDALKLAGGFMLFLLALEMVFDRRTQRREQSAEGLHARKGEDIAVFPIAVPMLAGPGAIATIILLMAHHAGAPVAQGMILAALALVLALTLASFLLANRLMALLGETVSTVFTRVLGIILAALAAQYMLDGIKGALIG